MRTSLFMTAIAAVGATSVGCARGSRAATYRGENAPCAVASPRYEPAARAPVTSGGTVVLSSRPTPARIAPPSTVARDPVPAPVFARASDLPPTAPATAFQPAAAPAPVFAPTCGSLASSGRPLNATCPVMLGNPVDPAVTAVYQGRVIAFSDYAARWKWNTDPERYAVNLPRMASGSAGDTIPVFASRTPTPSSPAPTGDALPLDPTLPSFDSLPPARSAPAMPPPGSLPPAAAAVTSPRALPPLLPRVPAAPTAKGPALKPPATSRATPPPACAPSLEDLTHEEDEECPGGNCRLPGR